jgi:hypothetical protein
LSQAVTEQQQKIDCLQRVLRINPGNVEAQTRLRQMFSPPEERVGRSTPPPPPVFPRRLDRLLPPRRNHRTWMPCAPQRLLIQSSNENRDCASRNHSGLRSGRQPW